MNNFVAAPLLFLLSLLYRLVVHTRLMLYRLKLLQTRKLDRPVISIGNITAGGTGKTPMAMYLVRLISGMGCSCAVVSRGYKGSLSARGGVVSDGTSIFMTVEECGDEPFMMAQTLACPVVIGKDRFKAGSLAIEKFSPDVIVLDDGFQHIRLARDLDIVLMDASSPLGNGRLLPAGLLREPLKYGLARADIIIFTRCPYNMDKIDIDRHMKLPENLLLYQKPCFHASHIPMIYKVILKNSSLIKLSPGDINQLSGLTAIAFSGIASNSEFLNTLEKAGVKVMSHLEFNDHYRYRNNDFEKINQAAAETKAAVIATTQKDFARLSGDCRWETTLVVIGIDIKMINGEDRLKSIFMKKKLS